MSSLLKAGRAVRVPGRRLFSISAQKQQAPAAEAAEAPEAADTTATPEALLNQLRTQPVRAFDKVQNSRELNEEFDSFIKEFVTDANIRRFSPSSTRHHRSRSREHQHHLVLVARSAGNGTRICG